MPALFDMNYWTNTVLNPDFQESSQTDNLGCGMTQYHDARKACTERLESTSCATSSGKGGMPSQRMQLYSDLCPALWENPINPSLADEMDLEAALQCLAGSQTHQQDVPDQSGGKTVPWKFNFLDSASLWKDMQEVMHSFLLVLSAEGTVIFVSDTVTQLLGYQQLSVIGHLFKDFVHPADLRTYSEHVLGTKHRQDISDFSLKSNPLRQRSIYLRLRDERFVRQKNDASYSLVNFVGHPNILPTNHRQTNTDQQDLWFVYVCRLVTTQFLHEVVEADNKPVECVTQQALDGTFLYTDSRWCRVTGYLPAEMCGQSLYNLVHPQDVKIATLAHHRVLTQNVEVTSVYRILTSGKKPEVVSTRSRLAFHPDSGHPQFIINLHTVLSQAEGRLLLESSQQEVTSLQGDASQSGLLSDFHKVLARFASSAAAWTMTSDTSRQPGLAVASTMDGDIICLDLMQHCFVPNRQPSQATASSSLAATRGPVLSPVSPTPTSSLPNYTYITNPHPSVSGSSRQGLEISMLAEHGSQTPNHISDTQTLISDAYCGRGYSGVPRRGRGSRGARRGGSVGRPRGRPKRVSIDGSIIPVVSRPRGRPRGSRSRAGLARMASLDSTCRADVNRTNQHFLHGSWGLLGTGDHSNSSPEHASKAPNSCQPSPTSPAYGRAGLQAHHWNSPHHQQPSEPNEAGNSEHSILENILKGRIRSPFSSQSPVRDSCFSVPASPSAIKSSGTNSLTKEETFYTQSSPSSALKCSGPNFQAKEPFAIAQDIECIEDLDIPKKKPRLQAQGHSFLSDSSVGGRSLRDLEELQVFSAQLRGKHVHIEQSLAVQDGILRLLESEFHNRTPAAHNSTLYRRLYQRLQKIKAIKTQQQEELWAIKGKLQHQLQSQSLITPTRRLAIVPPLPRPNTTATSIGTPLSPTSSVAMDADCFLDAVLAGSQLTERSTSKQTGEVSCNSQKKVLVKKKNSDISEGKNADISCQSLDGVKDGQFCFSSSSQQKLAGSLISSQHSGLHEGASAVKYIGVDNPSKTQTVKYISMDNPIKAQSLNPNRPQSLCLSGTEGCKESPIQVTNSRTFYLDHDELGRSFQNKVVNSSVRTLTSGCSSDGQERSYEGCSTGRAGLQSFGAGSREHPMLLDSPIKTFHGQEQHVVSLEDKPTSVCFNFQSKSLREHHVDNLMKTSRSGTVIVKEEPRDSMCGVSSVDHCGADQRLQGIASSPGRPQSIYLSQGGTGKCTNTYFSSQTDNNSHTLFSTPCKVSPTEAGGHFVPLCGSTVISGWQELKNISNVAVDSHHAINSKFPLNQ